MQHKLQGYVSIQDTSLPHNAECRHLSLLAVDCNRRPSVHGAQGCGIASTEEGVCGVSIQVPVMKQFATNDCFFATPAMFEAHDALLCIAEGRLLSEPERRRVTPEHWFKPAADMRVLFADLPEACDNTLAIARRCAVMM